MALFSSCFLVKSPSKYNLQILSTADNVVVVRVLLSHVRFLEITHFRLVVVSVVRKKVRMRIDRVPGNLVHHRLSGPRDPGVCPVHPSLYTCVPSAAFC